jgi:hypothetical protein
MVRSLWKNYCGAVEIHMARISKIIREHFCRVLKKAVHPGYPLHPFSASC